MADIEIKIDRGLCMGIGECARLAPNTYHIDNDDKSTVKDPKGEPEEQIVNAARSCPNFAIAVFKDGRKLTG